MKPLSEFTEGLRIDKTKAFNYGSENAEVYRAFDAGSSYVLDKLEAWLRDADEKLVRLAKHDRYYVDNEWLRRELLGTTRREGKK